MYRITIPAWTNKKTGEHKPSRSFNAELVETLLANSPQPADLIFKYYGDDYIDGVVAMAESISYRTCEECGAPGTSTSGGWIRVLCEEHKNGGA